jgi:ADP-heptose:LPS heptosyltransferase
LAPIKVGFQNTNGEGLYRGSFQNHPMSYNPHLHITRNFLALIEAIFGDSGRPLLKMKFADESLKMSQAVVTKESRIRVQAKIKELYPAMRTNQKILLVNPNASEFLPQRKWPLEYYIELVQLIVHNHSDYLILMTGSPKERPEIDLIVKAVDSPHCINFAGEVPFLDLIPLYSLSDVLITNDSGPGHFSSVTAIKSYVFFGPETPRLYGSLGNSTPIYAQFSCSPCVSAYNHRKTDCSDAQCLKVLRPLMVYAMIKASLTHSKIKERVNSIEPTAIIGHLM